MRAIAPRNLKASRTRNRWDSAGARYEVLERVDEGTLFVVYRVRDRTANRVMALKALKSTFTNHRHFTEALATAAEQSMQFTHPHLVTVNQVGEEEETLFLVTEWLPGQSLEARLRRAPFGRAEALSCTRQIAEALNYLHHNGTVHGDLRPRQVLAAADGSLKLTEVGLSEAFAAAGMAHADVLQEAVYYMAPERSDGALPTPSSDLYALGVMLYRMLTGRVPFDGPSPLSIAMRHRKDAPLRPSQFNPNCPPDLEEIALRLLEKDPQVRYPSAGRLLRDLAAGTNPSAAPYDDRDNDAPDDEELPANIVAPVAPPDRLPLRPTNGMAAADDLNTAAAAAVATPTIAAAPVIAAPAAVAPAAAATGAAVTGVGAAVDTADVDVTPVPRTPRRVLTRPAPRAADDDDNDIGNVNNVGDVDDDTDERRERKRHRRREALGAVLSIFWLLVAMGLLGGIVYGAYYFWVQGTPPDVTVPKYVGKSQAEAARALQAKGLKMVIGSEVYDPKRPAGTVIKGDTEAGKYVKSGREVTVTVSRGEEPIKMPELIELDLQRARQIIERGGMRLGMVADQYHDTVPQGYICGQYPEPGQSFRRSEPINLIVSKGPQPLGNVANPSVLPPPPPRPAPGMIVDPEEAITNPPKAPEVPMVSRTIAVRVAIPADGDAQEVRIVVRDAEGEHTVYRQTHSPGDLIDEVVEVTRQQGTTAIVRVYVDGKLEREQRI